jgi:hypothetical protein
MSPFWVLVVVAFAPATALLLNSIGCGRAESLELGFSFACAILVGTPFIVEVQLRKLFERKLTAAMTSGRPDLASPATSNLQHKMRSRGGDLLWRRFNARLRDWIEDELVPALGVPLKMCYVYFGITIVYLLSYPAPDGVRAWLDAAQSLCFKATTWALYITMGLTLLQLPLRSLWRKHEAPPKAWFEEDLVLRVLH